MKYKRFLLILFAILFFLTALTSYVNRVIFPHLIKKIAIERIEKNLKRKIEIGSIRFSWVKGFIIDKIKIYEKDSNDTVFAQADQVTFGIIFFPGLKHYRITIPYINVRYPCVHLIRTAKDIWNFSDLFATPSATAPGSSNTEKSPPLVISWGGITISDGKLLMNDIADGRKWSEFFDNINLKLSLSYKGISYDFTADIPGKKGSLGATVYYQPITKNTQAKIHLKNIDTASYLSLINIPDTRLDSGIIKEINLNISHDQNKTSAQGDVIMKNFDITNQEQNFKGDIEIRGLDAQYQDGNISARGQMTLNNIQTKVPGLYAGGSVQAKVSDFEMTHEGVNFIGSLQGQDIFVNLKDRQVNLNAVSMENIRVRKDKDGIQSVGSIKTQGLFIKWPDENLRGDIALKNVTMNMADENNILLKGELQADNFSTSLNDKNFKSRHILLEDATLKIVDQKNIALNTKLSLNEMRLAIGNNILTSSLLQTNQLSCNVDDGVMKITSSVSSSKTKLVLGDHKVIEADPQMELTLRMPLNAPQEITYKGSITLSNGLLRGISPFAVLDNIELDADFQNNEATINALSINLLDTNLRVNGTLKNFKNPVLNITADADGFNLEGIKNLYPKIVSQYGLSFDGTSVVKIKFEGRALDPLTAKILMVASVKNVSIASSKYHQRIKNITGILEATHDSLQWRDTTATFLGKKYSLAGTIDHFKSPNILLSLNGPGLQFRADLSKRNDLITINALTGKYLNASFNSDGTIRFIKGKPELDINTNATMLLEDLIKDLPYDQNKAILPLKPSGVLSLRAKLSGDSLDWMHSELSATITSPSVHLMGYTLTDMKINFDKKKAMIKDFTFNGKLYEGTVHAVGSLNLWAKGMPYDLAFNVDNADLHQFKMDSPFKMQEINGKFYFTTLIHGTIADFKNNLHASGSLAIREGFLGEFNVFKGLLDVLNDAMSLSKVMITDVEANFTVENQKISTDNLRLKGPTIVLLGKGWVNFDQICDLDMTVDLSSGVVPAIAHDVLKSLNIRIYDKISDPKFKKRISVPQVINTLIKNLWQ